MSTKQLRQAITPTHILGSTGVAEGSDLGYQSIPNFAANIQPELRATQGEAQTGTNNTNFITPLRMREGFNASGSAPVYACRAWVNFDGTTSPGTIRASGNVSSVTKNDTGDYTVNFTSAMPDTNYAMTAAGSGGPAGGNKGPYVLARTTTSQRVTVLRDTGAFIDADVVGLAFFR